MTAEATVTTDQGWNSGFVCGLLTARYYALRHQISDGFFRTAAPTDLPEVVSALLAQMTRVAIDERLFEKSWASLDHLLLCESTDELQRALALVPDRHLQ
jgi:hypothetical protein